jgi:hypothetical protein
MDGFVTVITACAINLTGKRDLRVPSIKSINDPGSFGFPRIVMSYHAADTVSLSHSELTAMPDLTLIHEIGGR